MNAADRQVIRNHAERILDGRGDKPRYHAEQIIAILDKPQPESAGDARELAIDFCSGRSFGNTAIINELTEKIQTLTARIADPMLEARKE